VAKSAVPRISRLFTVSSRRAGCSCGPGVCAWSDVAGYTGRDEAGARDDDSYGGGGGGRARARDKYAPRRTADGWPRGEKTGKHQQRKQKRDVIAMTPYGR